MNYNKSCGQRSKRTSHRCASCVPTPSRRTHKTNCPAAQRITMSTAPTSKTSCTYPRPASMCAPRGGQRYKPRPGPRRHHLTHAAGMGHTSPQRRHQHKAPCIVPLPGAAAATHNMPQTKATLPCINQRRMAGWLYFFIVTRPNGIRALRHQSASSSSSTLLNTDSKEIPCS